MWSQLFSDKKEVIWATVTCSLVSTYIELIRRRYITAAEIKDRPEMYLISVLFSRQFRRCNFCIILFKQKLRIDALQSLLEWVLEVRSNLNRSKLIFHIPESERSMVRFITLVLSQIKSRQISSPKASDGQRFPCSALLSSWFSWGGQGSGPNRGRSPVERGDFPYVCTSVHPPPLLAIQSEAQPARPEAQPARP